MKIVIAGGSQRESTKRYRQEICRVAGEDKRIVMTGPVSGRLKHELLSHCRFLLSPSANEGLPLTLLEAAGCGRFSVASDIPAHREVIRDGHNGLLFDSTGREQFVKAVSKALSLPETRGRQMGDTALEGMKETFDWERTTDRFEELFGRLLNET